MRLIATNTETKDTQTAKLEAAAPRLAAALLFVEEEAIADGRPCPACGRWMESTARSSIVHRDECELDAALRAAGLR